MSDCVPTRVLETSFALNIVDVVWGEGRGGSGVEGMMGR